MADSAATRGIRIAPPPPPQSRRRARPGRDPPAEEASNAANPPKRARRWPTRSRLDDDDNAKDIKKNEGPTPAQLVRRLSRSGALVVADMDSDDVKALKRQCRTNDAFLRDTISALFAVLGTKSNSRPRLAALSLLDTLFTRSELARDLICTRLADITTLTLGPPGTDLSTVPASAVLPPPAPLATQLRAAGLRALFDWHHAFGADHAPLQVALSHAEHALHADFGPFRRELAAQALAVREERAAVAQRQADAVTAFTAAEPALAATARELESLLAMAEQGAVDEFTRAVETAPAVPAGQQRGTTYSDIARAHGLGSNAYRLELDLSATATSISTRIDPVVLAELERVYRDVHVRHLPLLDAWLGDLADATEARRVRGRLSRLAAQAEDVGVSLVSGFQRALAREEHVSSESESEGSDAEFEEVPVPVLPGGEGSGDERELFGEVSAGEEGQDEVDQRAARPEEPARLVEDAASAGPGRGGRGRGRGKASPDPRAVLAKVLGRSRRRR
ncbi:hypothetical protein AMAG_16699 [Allomyces macrogynus ATCC 38327]|uniref:VHS domain-containing protein n=1 Tax=Allomyces macrogynus (strain ATCC 38327) TaxID=578462 RepID=A0A0L0TBX1_ALLM3|nr:hypothetical protein AMAG_16699 [Allomyces macrogynus ATCC 38327]|eukprot:KNE72216.1 hypothetical protein AMAG_16699 [Allomyces macrogynus ATCC 38327]